MKKIIQNIEKQLEALRELIQVRQDYADGKSEKWQESEKGEDYMDTTLNIECQADELENIIDELKDFI